MAAVLMAAAGLTVPCASASAGTLADCTASLSPWSASWTAQCAAPHTVSVRMDRQWYWLTSPGFVYSSSATFSHQVAPGTPWSERIYFIPEQVTVQLCLTAYQDSTLQIAPRTC